MESETTTRSESLATYRDIPQDRQHPAPRPIRTSRLDARATGRFFTLPQGGSLRRDDEAGRAAYSARWVDFLSKRYLTPFLRPDFLTSLREGR